MPYLKVDSLAAHSLVSLHQANRPRAGVQRLKPQRRENPMPPKSPSAVVEIQNDAMENGQVTDTVAQAPKVAKPKTTHMVPVTVPNALYDIIAKQAEEGKVSIAFLARKALADTVGYTLSAFTRARTRKYGSKEEAKAAQKDRYQRAQLLLAALEAGEIDSSILDKMRAQQAAAKAAELQSAVTA